jgi:dipeptidyl-peptidase-3
MGRFVIDIRILTAGSTFRPGFTAIVNKALSAKYEKLVDQAPEFIQAGSVFFVFLYNLFNCSKALPWGKDFEVDEFKR